MVTKQPNNANTSKRSHQYCLNNSIVVKFVLKIDNFFMSRAEIFVGLRWRRTLVLLELCLAFILEYQPLCSLFI